MEQVKVWKGQIQLGVNQWPVEASMNHAPAQNPHLGLEGGYCHPEKGRLLKFI